MKQNTGYREMLRDRCPKVVSRALKWCKVKEAWLNQVYKNFVWLYSSKKDRLEATKTILGTGNKNGFCFEDTISWDNLTQEEKSMWKNVANWVSWFQKKYAYIENAYFISKQKGYELVDIKYEIMLNYLTDMCPRSTDSTEVRAQKNKQVNDLADFLIDCFENRI